MNILLIEDDPDDAFFMKRAAAAAGITHQMDWAADGQQAVDYLSTKPAPALILLDLKLPLRSGHEVLEWIHKADVRSPVVVLTTSREASDICRSYELCASSYLVKPPTYEALLALVKAIKAYWLDLNVIC